MAKKNKGDFSAEIAAAGRAKMAAVARQKSGAKPSDDKIDVKPPKLQRPDTSGQGKPFIAKEVARQKSGASPNTMGLGNIHMTSSTRGFGGRYTPPNEKCPKCGSTNLSEAEYEDGREVVVCNDCDHEWPDEYGAYG